jgi:hypothetical protein
VIAGHDIGAAIAWQSALLRPDRFRAVIALSPPFRSRGFGDAGPPTTLMPRTENAVFYQLFLQNPAAKAGLERDLRLTFRYQFYTLSGDSPPSEGIGGLPPGMMPRKGSFMTDPPSLPAWVTESDIDVYVKEFARSGFHGPLAWWRNIDRGWELMAPFAGTAVTVPALYMAGNRDFVASVFSQDIAKQSALVPRLRPPIMLPGLRSLDPAGTRCGGQRRHDRLPSAVVGARLRSTREPDQTERGEPMKFIIPFLIAALPVAAVAQSPSGQAPNASGVTLPKTTEVMVILSVRQGVTRQQIMTVMPSEVRETVKLYLDGKIRHWYSRGDGKGAVFLIDAKTQDEARAVMEPCRSQRNSWWITNIFPSDP